MKRQHERESEIVRSVQAGILVGCSKKQPGERCNQCILYIRDSRFVIFPWFTIYGRRISLPFAAVAHVHSERSCFEIFQFPFTAAKPVQVALGACRASHKQTEPRWCDAPLHYPDPLISQTDSTRPSLFLNFTMGDGKRMVYVKACCLSALLAG